MPLNNSNINNTTFVAEGNTSRLSPAIIRTPPPPISTSSLINNLINTITTTGPMPVPRSNNGIVSSATIQSSQQHNVRTAGHLSLSRDTSGVLGSTSGVLGSNSGSLGSSADASATVAAAASNKILGRNVNGTLVMTSAPSNEAELQLYRVMQRASLLAYYDTLLEMGGDDVQQLCEAGEEEFLEIMALVGMASKPLHVRRLQKALQEWVNNPAMFQAPILPGGLSSGAASGSSPVFPSSTSSSSLSSSHEVHSSTPRAINLSSSSHQHALPPPVSQSPAPPLVSPGQMANLTRPSPPSANGACSHVSSRHGSPSPGLQLAMKDSGNSGGSTGCGSSGGAPSPGLPLHVHGADSLSPGSPPPLQLTPTLAEAQIQRLAESAKQLAASIPSLEPKPQNSKKRICKDLEYVMAMAEDDPRRMDEIRKYAAIYGRFDCKRKPEKPLTLHEVSVNEAAAQICRLVPALLTRRDELFPLARQVVRDSGYQYSKAHANLGCPGFTARAHNGDDVSSSSAAKRMRLLDPSEVHADIRRQERLEQISEELRGVAERQEELRQLATGGASEAAAWQSQLEALQSRQAQLAGEQAELGRHAASHKHSRGYRRSARISATSYGDAERPDTDDTDSQFSYSNASSPSQDVGDSRDSTTRDGDSALVPGESISVRSASSINKSPNKLLSKQPPSSTGDAILENIAKLVQETLLGEGLRVVKEMVASQERRDLARDDETPPPAHVTSSARGQHPLMHHYEAYYQHHNKVQVIAASGGNIIAVANPALSMSPAIHAADSAEAKVNSGSPRPPSASPHPMASLFKQEPLSPCKSE